MGAISTLKVRWGKERCSGCTYRWGGEEIWRERETDNDPSRIMLEEADEGFVLVGKASDGASALDVVGKVQPDVVLMDLRMPGMDGLEAIQRMRAAWPQVAVLILTTYNEDDLMIRGLQVGACGYLLKTERTVRAHLSTIYMKLNVDSRAQAVAVAIEGGLLLPRTRPPRG